MNSYPRLDYHPTSLFLLTHHGQHPLLKVGGFLGAGVAAAQRSIDEPVQARNLVFNVQHAQVVVEWIGHIAMVWPIVGEQLSSSGGGVGADVCKEEQGPTDN